MYKIYQIEYGDTLEGIASKTGTSVENIKQINGFNSDGDLVVGSLMIVPRGSNAIFQMYTVKQGDSVYSIARSYGVDPEIILTLNGLNKNDYIYPNQELTIPTRDVVIYITKDGDTIDFITNNLGIDANTLVSENEKIFVIPDQLIVHKKETNN